MSKIVAQLLQKIKNHFRTSLCKYLPLFQCPLLKILTPTTTISAASYRLAKCPTLKTAEKQPKRVPSGSRQNSRKTAGKTPGKTPGKQSKPLFSGCFSVTHSAPFSAVFRLFSMSGIWHLCSWPQRILTPTTYNNGPANQNLSTKAMFACQPPQIQSPSVGTMEESKIIYAARAMNSETIWGTGGILFREYCFGEENSLSSAANSVSSARNSVSSRLHTNNRPKGTH